MAVFQAMPFERLYDNETAVCKMVEAQGFQIAGQELR